MDTIRSPEPELEVRRCDRCGLDHPIKTLLTYPEIARFTRFAIASLYAYHSRGAVLPRPYGRKNGNPRWTSCSIAKWIAGQLAPEDVEPSREARRAAGRRAAKVGAFLLALALTATAAAQSPEAFPSLSVGAAHQLVDAGLAITVKDFAPSVSGTWSDGVSPVVAIVFNGDGPKPRSGILFVYDPGPELFVPYAAMRGYTTSERYESPFMELIAEATRHLHPEPLRRVRIPLLEDVFALGVRLAAAMGLGEFGSLIVSLVTLFGPPFAVVGICSAIGRLFTGISLAITKNRAISRLTRTLDESVSGRD